MVNDKVSKLCTLEELKAIAEEMGAKESLLDALEIFLKAKHCELKISYVV